MQKKREGKRIEKVIIFFKEKREKSKAIWGKKRM